MCFFALLLVLYIYMVHWSKPASVKGFEAAGSGMLDTNRDSR